MGRAALLYRIWTWFHFPHTQSYTQMHTHAQPALALELDLNVEKDQLHVFFRYPQGKRNVQQKNKETTALFLSLLHFGSLSHMKRLLVIFQ